MKCRHSLHHRFASISIRVSLVLVSSLLLCSFQSASGKQRVFVFAIRDSRLLTLNPNPAGTKPDKIRVTLLKRDQLIIYTDYHVNIRLPRPASDFSSQPVNDLDRIAPDSSIKSRVEKALATSKEYAVVDSPDEADSVLVIEATYISLAFDYANGNRGGYVSIASMGSDREANMLQSLLAISVPAAKFIENPGDGSALMAARNWEGSVVFNRSDPSSIKPARVEDLVGQFLDKRKRLPYQFPLCAATPHPLLLADRFPETIRKYPVLRNVISDGSATPAAKSPSTSTIKVDVSLVTVPITVSDVSGRPISDLQPSEFHLYENDEVQEVDQFIATSKPFDVALMLDTSASMSMKIEDAQQAALRFIDKLRPDDRLLIASFNDRIIVHSELEAGSAKIRPAVLLSLGEGSRVFDAIQLLVEDRLNALPARKALVLFTDGADTRSRINDAKGVLERLQESQVLVYAIQYDTQKENRLIEPNVIGGAAQTKPKIRPNEAVDTNAMYSRATEFLKDLSETSGGRVYKAQAAKDLDEALTQIASELTMQYTLCYYPRNQNKDGALRRIRVEVDRPGVKVHARTGYRLR